MEENNNTAIQPNRLTMAKYEFSRYEKLIYYQVILQLKSKMGQPELWGENIQFIVPVEEIDKDRNYNLIRKAFASLRRKDFTIEDKKNNYYFDGGLINWGKIKDGLATISIADEVVKPLFDITQGYTAYSATVVLTLKSNYAMRFYEYCSRFKDTGHWHTTLEALRVMLKCEDKYPVYNDFRLRTIEVARRELEQLYDNGQSDIKFTYTEKREGRGRGGTVVGLSFTIFWSKKGGRKLDPAPSKPEDYYFLLNFLKNHFPTDKKYQEKILNYADSNQFLKHFANIVEIAEKKGNPPAYFRTAIKNEFPNFKI